MRTNCKQRKRLWNAASILGVILFLCSGTFLRGEDSSAPEKKTLHILTIGNSFSYSLFDMFEPVVRSVPGFDIDLEGLNIGGCTLQRHWENIEKEEANRDDRVFEGWTYREKLQSKAWDFVSIQQSSPLSWQPESFWPEGEELAHFAKECAPTAEIVLQQTWSYRSDDTRLAEWNLTQKEMADLIIDSYHQAAKRLNLRVIPVGLAIQLARENQPGGYQPLNPSDYKYPDLPSMDRYFTGAAEWSEDKTQIVGDRYHLNLRGRYLQACVWFAFLYDHTALDVTYVPDGITEADAQFIREMAQKAVEEYRQDKE